MNHPGWHRLHHQLNSVEDAVPPIIQRFERDRSGTENKQAFTVNHMRQDRYKDCPLTATLRETFGEQVRLQRVIRRWSQEALACAAGLDRSHIGAIERAEVGASIDTMEKIAAAFEIDISQLLKPLRSLYVPQDHTPPPSS